MSEDAFMENLPQVLGAPYVRKNRERRGCGWELSILSLEFWNSQAFRHAHTKDSGGPHSAF